MTNHSHLHGVSYVDAALTITSPVEDPTLSDAWSRIVVPAEIKDRLLNHALLAIRLRRLGIGSIGLPLDGLALLSGRAGTGKTSLARGLASEISRELAGEFGHVRLLEVNLHLLPSELLGRTQRNIVQLFQEELPALAEDGPIVVVLDEVEALAVSRARTSTEINPADVFRGTSALLSALDWMSRRVPGSFVVGTTNLVDFLDEAILSRCDLLLELPLPSTAVLTEILIDTVSEIARLFPGSPLAGTTDRLGEVAEYLAGSDGRQARKFILEALAYRRDTAVDPASLTFEDLLKFAIDQQQSIGTSA